jgi:hypothetical protein
MLSEKILFYVLKTDFLAAAKTMQLRHLNEHIGIVVVNVVSLERVGSVISVPDIESACTGRYKRKGVGMGGAVAHQHAGHVPPTARSYNDWRRLQLIKIGTERFTKFRRAPEKHTSTEVYGRWLGRPEHTT